MTLHKFVEGIHVSCGQRILIVMYVHAQVQKHTDVTMSK